MALIFDCSVREHPTIVRLVHQRRAVIVHLNWVCIFLGFHSFVFRDLLSVITAGDLYNRLESSLGLVTGLLGWIWSVCRWCSYRDEWH